MRDPRPGFRAHVGALDNTRDPHIRAQTWTRAAQRGSLAANAAAVEGGLLDDQDAGVQGTIET